MGTGGGGDCDADETHHEGDADDRYGVHSLHPGTARYGAVAEADGGKQESATAIMSGALPGAATPSTLASRSGSRWWRKSQVATMGHRDHPGHSRQRPDDRLGGSPLQAGNEDVG